MKLAATSEGLVAISYLGCTIVVLCVYAFLWQKILKFVPLTTAFMYKSVTVIYGMLFAHFLFKEEITSNNIWGASLIVFGIIILGWKT